MADSLTVVSLYSGAGGLDLGFAQAGFRPILANEIVPAAAQTHSLLHTITDPQWKTAAVNFNDTEVVTADVRDIMSEFYKGQADIVIGGPPCQGFSVAGHMDPRDPRSRHVFNFLDVVKIIRPRAFVMENVAALARSPKWVEIRHRLVDEVSADYKTFMFVLNAAEWEVPQKRERMFFIGVPLDAADVDLTPKDLGPITVRNVLSTLPTWGDPGNNTLSTAKIVPAKNPILRRSPYAGMIFNGQGRVINLDAPSPTLPASMGGNRTPIIDQRALTERAVPWIETYHHRLAVEGENPLSELPKDAFLRRLTVEEAAALQTFPKDMPFQGPRSEKFRQIGNAVPPVLALAVAEAVKAVLI